MKKNLLSIIILAVLVIDLVLTAIVMFSTTGAMNKTSKLVTDIATALSLELEADKQADENGFVVEGEQDTSIFIYPGYKFKCLNGLITNFHLPESTLIMLVSALASRENVLNAYNEAIKERYRFFSFGDAMLIL